MGAVAWAIRQRPVSHPRSSNRTCRSPASGSPTGFTVRHTGSKPTARGFCTVITRLRPSTQQSRTTPVFDGVLRLIANHHDLAIFDSAPEVRALSSAGITRLRRSYDPVRLPPWPSPVATLRPLPSPRWVSPDYPNHLSDVPCPLPRRIERVRVSIASPLTRPSPNGRRVGIRIVTFEACSGFTRVTARQIAQPPKGDLCHEAPALPVARPSRSSATRSIDNSRVDSSSTDDSRLRGALPIGTHALQQDRISIR